MSVSEVGVSGVLVLDCFLFCTLSNIFEDLLIFNSGVVRLIVGVFGLRVVLLHPLQLLTKLPLLPTKCLSLPFYCCLEDLLFFQ